jgi:TonB family protein
MKISVTTLALMLLLFAATCAHAQDSPQPLPRVVEHSDPNYPPLARQTSIQGDVHVKITTDGEVVTTVEALDGHPLLKAATLENVRTWKFAHHKPATFVVTFHYKLNSGNTDVEFLDTPGVVRIGAETPTISVYNADPYLGTWQMEWKSRLGMSRRILELSESGSETDWINATFLTKRKAADDDEDDDKNEEISAYGHKEDNIVSFSVKVHASNGKQTPTFFVGILKGKKITGTFIDNAGLTGTWTAVWVSDKPVGR